MSDVNRSGEQTAAQALQTLVDELVAVEEQLQGALRALYSPFQELAQSQLQRAAPLRRAAVVLTVGTTESEEAETHNGHAHNGDRVPTTLRQQRIDLATALEMLNIALAIHQLLLAAGTDQADNPNQRSIAGSVILTGDYCFTQSALFAAKTCNVQVVEIFSQTLKSISEGMLRQIFATRDGETTAAAASFNIEAALCEAGVVGASALIAGGPAGEQHGPASSAADANSTFTQLISTQMPIIQQWASAWPTVADEHHSVLLAPLSAHQQQQWQTLLRWLTNKHLNL